MRTINDLRNKTAGMYRIAYQNIAAVRRNPLNLWVERASKRREKGGGPASGYCPALPQHPLPVNRDHLPALEGLQEHIHGAAPTTKERDQDVTAHGASTLGVHRPALIRTRCSLTLGFAAARFTAKPSALWLAAGKVKVRSRSCQRHRHRKRIQHRPGCTPPLSVQVSATKHALQRALLPSARSVWPSCLECDAFQSPVLKL
jgi:hypothetical protein